MARGCQLVGLEPGMACGQVCLAPIVAGPEVMGSVWTSEDRTEKPRFLSSPKRSDELLPASCLKDMFTQAMRNVLVASFKRAKNRSELSWYILVNPKYHHPGMQQYRGRMFAVPTPYQAFEIGVFSTCSTSQPAQAICQGLRSDRRLLHWAVQAWPHCSLLHAPHPAHAARHCRLSQPSIQWAWALGLAGWGQI